MDIVRIIITFSLLLSIVCIWRKIHLANLTRILTAIHFILLGLTILLVILLFNDFKLTGTYSNTIVVIAFVVSGILVYGLTRNRFVKLYSSILFWINTVFQIALFFAPNTLLFFYAVAYVLFQPPYMTKELTDKATIEFYEPFLGPPPIYLTEEKFGILKSQRSMTFKNGDVYNKSQIRLEQTNVDSFIACCIIQKDSCVKDTLIFK